jgi:hypothetical protein
MKNALLPFYRKYQQVLTFLKNSSILFDYPIVKSVVKNMETHVEPLKTIVESSANDVEIDTEAYEEVINTKGYQLGKCLEDIATQKGDTAMVKRIHISYSVLTRKSTGNKIQNASSILNEAKANIAELANYKITKEYIDDYEAVILKLVEVNTHNVKNASDRRVKQLQQVEVMKLCKDDLQRCDSFVETIRLQYPEVYRTYNEQRKGKEPSTVYSRIRVIDADTAQPVLNALVTVTSTTRSKNGEKQVVLKRRTGKTGEVRISNSDKDIFTVVAEKLGCSSSSSKLVIADSTPIVLELSIKKLHIS